MIYFKKIAYPGKYQDDSAIPQLLGYIMRQDKTPHCLIGAVNIDNPVNPAESMITVSEKYGKNSRIRLHHFILTFDSSLNESYELIMKIARSIAFEIGKLYQIVYSAHEDTEHIHIHFVFNAVSFVTGKKYHGGKTEYGELIQLCSNILSQAGLFPLIPVNYHPDPLDIQSPYCDNHYWLPPLSRNNIFMTPVRTTLFVQAGIFYTNTISNTNYVFHPFNPMRCQFGDMNKFTCISSRAIHKSTNWQKPDNLVFLLLLPRKKSTGSRHTHCRHAPIHVY